MWTNNVFAVLEGSFLQFSLFMALFQYTFIDMHH